MADVRPPPNYITKVIFNKDLMLTEAYTVPTTLLLLTLIICPYIAKLSPSQPVNPQLGETVGKHPPYTLHPPYTQNSSFEVLQSFS